MKQLLLMRHASTINNIVDSDRVLSPLGIKEAKKAGTFVSTINIQKVLVSPAKRTLQTLELIGQESKFDNIEVVNDLYYGSNNLIFDKIIQQDDDINSLMIIGHNPSIYQLAMSLAEPSSTAYEYILKTHMPNARIIILNFSKLLSWTALKSHKGDIYNIFTPLINE